MSSASGSFEDFMEQFRARHAKDFKSDSRPEMVVKAPMAKVEVKEAVRPVSVAPVAVVDDWDGVEVETEQEEYWK